MREPAKKKPRPKSPPVSWPQTYEDLVRQLMREHPGHSQAEIEQAIGQAQVRQAKAKPQ